MPAYRSPRCLLRRLRNSGEAVVAEEVHEAAVVARVEDVFRVARHAQSNPYGDDIPTRRKPVQL